MERIQLGPLNGMYPSLTTIVGADIDAKPNWITIAHVGIMNHGSKDIPQYLSIGLHKSHHTNLGIHKHREFSINIPSQEMMSMTDYAGLVSGANVDKSELFEVERGILKHAPLIKACPLSMEMRLSQTIQLGHHELFIGELVNTIIDEQCMTNSKPDLAKINPILFDFMQIDYWSIGNRTGKPWRDGKIHKTENNTTI